MKTKMKKALSILLILSFSASLVFGCGKKEEESADNVDDSVVTESTESGTEVEIDTAHEGQVQNIYNGYWFDENDESLYVRPVACMVENSKATLPQYGLNSADIIYEIPVEGYMTRFMAIIQDYATLEKFGNIRSCRTPFVPMALYNGAIYIHAGGSPTGLALLDTDIIDHINVITGKGEKFLTYDPNRKSPHDKYFTGENCVSEIADYGYGTTIDPSFSNGLKFASEENGNTLLADGSDCAVYAPYYFESDPYFVYDEETGYYYRYEYGNKQVDGLTDEQLYVKNIIIQNTSAYYYEEYVFTDYIAGGDGCYISNGKQIHITWKKTTAEDDSPIVYYTDDGNVLELNPGRTWICVSENTYADKNTRYETYEDFENR